MKSILHIEIVCGQLPDRSSCGLLVPRVGPVPVRPSDVPASPSTGVAGNTFGDCAFDPRRCCFLHLVCS